MRLRFAFLIAGVCLLFVLMAASAGKAEDAGGRFTLPFAATWGNTVLPPGDYTFTVISTFGSIRYLDVRGKAASVFILPAETKTGADGGNSHLTALTLGENHFIETLALKESNLTFEFRLPKRARVPARFTNLMVSHMGQSS